MNLPSWVSGLANLDDEALAVFANRGLVRRALKLEVTLLEASRSAVEVACEGLTVRLTPGGPKALRCPCPVAGTCVHVIAACLWTRGVARSGEPAGSHGVEASVDAAGGGPQVLAEVLAWSPEAVNRAAGIAAVRRVSREVLSGPTTVEAKGGRLEISWPESPRILAIAGGGPADMLVEGSHSDVTERAWRLAAVVRVFAAHGRTWPWPQSHTEGVLSVQIEAAADVVSIAERLVTDGLARVGPQAADRLSRAGQRARLEDLPLLARLCATAAAHLKALQTRDDHVDEASAFSALSQAWALAKAVASGMATTPGKGPEPEDEGVRRLVPLAAQWWQATSGARGLTLYAWDDQAQRLERVTTGRAAGADPSFVPTWVGPLLWGCSAEQLCAGPFDIQGAQRRDDGTYSPTTRTTARPGTWAGFDLNRLVDRINAAADGPSRVVFGAPNQPVRLIRPRTSFGLGAIELDEVNQRFIWPVVDHLGCTHRLTLGASEKSAQVLAWLTGRIKLCALVVVGDELQAAFHLDSGQLALVSLTLSPVPLQKVAASWRRFFTRLDKERRATAPARELDDLQRLCAGVDDLALALAAGGVRALSEREHDALGRRRREASDLALGTLVAALEPLASGQAGAAEVLTLRFLLDRLEALLA